MSPNYFWCGVNSSIVIGNPKRVLRKLPRAHIIVTSLRHHPQTGEPIWPPQWPQAATSVCQQMWLATDAKTILANAKDLRGWHIAQDITWKRRWCDHTPPHHAFRRLHGQAFHLSTQSKSAKRLAEPIMTSTETRMPCRMGSLFLEEDLPTNTHRPGFFVPNDVVASIIQHSTEPCDLLIDPFPNDGQIMEIAAKLDRKVIGIASDEDHAKALVLRLAQQELFSAEPM